MKKEEIILGIVLLSATVGITLLTIKLYRNKKKIAEIEATLKEDN